MAPGIQKKAMFKHIHQVDISLLFIYTLLYFFFEERYEVNDFVFLC